MGRMSDLAITLERDAHPCQCTKCPARLKQVVGCCDWYSKHDGMCTLPNDTDPLMTLSELIDSWAKYFSNMCTLNGPNKL